MENDLLTLATRCEAASGPSAELDARIRCAVYAPASAYVEQSKINGAWVIYDGVEHRSGRPRGWHGPGHMQAFTTSLDAAMTLVPAGLFPTMDFETVRCWLRKAGGFDVDGGPAYGFAVTMPLALCAAALRARAASSEPAIEREG